MVHLHIKVDPDVTPKTKTAHIMYLEECIKILNYTKDLVDKIDENNEYTINMLRFYIADMLFEVERNASIIESVLTNIYEKVQNKPIKLAKCGNRSLADCQKRFNKYPECKTCTLVHHHFIPIYIYINGIKYKRCPHCKQYYKIDMFAKNNGKHKRLCSSWCKKCINQ